MSTETLLGLPQIAARLGTSLSGMTQLSNAGKLPEPDAEVGARPLWSQRTIDVWLCGYDAGFRSKGRRGAAAEVEREDGSSWTVSVDGREMCFLPTVEQQELADLRAENERLTETVEYLHGRTDTALAGAFKKGAEVAELRAAATVSQFPEKNQ